jgi:hypothetical protein
VRKLRNDEVEVLKAVLSMAPNGEAYLPSETAFVSEMRDGGMGSLRFIAESDTPQEMGRELVRAHFVDEDRIPVSVSVYLDTHGRLFEIDFWKVDFSPLRRYPRPQDLCPGDPGPVS